MLCRYLDFERFNEPILSFTSDEDLREPFVIK